MADHIKPASAYPNGGIALDNPFIIKNDNQTTSISSESSADTLHENESSDARSNSSIAISQSSPLSPNDLNFNNLSIHSDAPQTQFGDNRYMSPFHRGLRSHYGSSFFGGLTRGVVQKDPNPRSRTPYTGRTATGMYRNSRTWMSPDQQAQQEFQVIRNAMRRLFKYSEVSKWKLTDYIAHREAMIASQANKLASQVKEKEVARDSRSPSIPLETQYNLRRWGLEGNFDEHGNYGRVLGEQTIWCEDWENGKDDIAPWPTTAELKWEGDDRAKTGVGRFLPLPREEGPPTIQWNQLPVIDQYSIDQVARIPTMEDIYLPVDDQIEPDKSYLWSKRLEMEMDALLES
ncbi:hypothetical protein BKA66DRAFT_439219 [Pyrenochaeta sp. MPI-SDFR-AT-0127]|nr:hypothetical protein BKA66DRAFT_439219 [Pyrenochaeta sp. MPI-SDFR-AT-0127]